MFFQFFVDFGKFVYSSIALQLNHFTLAIFASLVTNTRLHPLSVSGFHVTRNKYRPTAALNTPKFAKTTTLCINIYYFCQYRMNKEFTTFTQLFFFSHCCCHRSWGLMAWHVAFVYHCVRKTICANDQVTG